LIQLREHFDPPMPDENDVEMSHSRHFGSWAKRLVIAHTVGEYLSCGTLFAVSMQGQKVKLQMSEATVEALDPFGRRENKDTQSTTDLVTNMEQLSIQNGTASLESSVKLVVQSLNDDKKNALLLYQIRHDTTIQCENHENAPDDDLTKVSSQPLKPLVAGLESIVTQVQSALVVPLLHPELFFNEGSSSQKSVLKPPKGILLHGPSGVGKSSLALQVGQNLESSGQFHVERVHCTLLQSQTAFVGQAERELVKLFEKAQVPRPGKKGCLLILDEVHLICPCRQGNDLGADRLASTLLALLDGIGTESSTGDSASKRFYPTVILAVTTNPGMLDAALRRPGRLDSEIEVPIPDEPATKANILQFHLDNLGANTSTITEDNWLSLAGRAKGFTGADLKLAAKEAVRKCAIQDPHADSSVMTLEILQQAVACVKPSAIKAVTVEVPRVPWTSIGGMDDVKTQLREAIELPLTHGDMFEKLGIRPPRGVLLYGPPGCSKTLMARALATEGHMNFLAVKGPELLSKWLGESERALAALFRRARLASPAVIFFDEVDAIASRRGGGGGGGERLLSQLLTELDGIQHGSGAGSKERVVIVCATNRPDLLDGALMRPGRIDRMIYVGVPDASSRERILRIGLKGKACATDIDFAQLVDEKVSGGLSGAELIAACRDAALKAMEEYEDAKEKRGETDEDPMMSQQVPMIRMDHLTTALMEMEHQITPEMLEFYASFQGKKLA
jgi:SpoVK/Ycf46/Vps4 family AAA+-type ATPase